MMEDVELKEKVRILEQKQVELAARQEQSIKELQLRVFIVLAILFAIAFVSWGDSEATHKPVEIATNRCFDTENAFANSKIVSPRRDIAEAESKTAALRAEVDKLQAEVDKLRASGATVRIDEIISEQSERIAANSVTRFTALQEEVSGLIGTLSREFEMLKQQLKPKQSEAAWSAELRQDLVDMLRDKQAVVTSKLESVLLKEDVERLRKNEAALKRAIDVLLEDCVCSSPLIEVFSIKQDIAFLAHDYNGSERLQINMTVVDHEIRRLTDTILEIFLEHIVELAKRHRKFRAEFESELEAMKLQMHDSSRALEENYTELWNELRVQRREAAKNRSQWVEFRAQIISTVEEHKVDTRSQIQVLSRDERHWMNVLWWSLVPSLLVLLVIVYLLHKMSNKQEGDKQHLVAEIETQRGRVDQLTSKQAEDKRSVEIRMDGLATTQREYFERESAARQGITEQQQASQQQIEAQRGRIDGLASKQEDDRQNIEVRLDELASLQRKQQEDLQQQIDELRRQLTTTQETDRTLRDGSGLPESPMAPLGPTIPLHIAMTDFFKHKTDGDIWYSKPFYTHARGYKMCLAVHANGIASVKGKYVSVFVHLMRGEFDDELVWPFQGKIRVCLLNQFKGGGHRELTLSFKQSGDRVVTGERAGSGPGDKCLVSYHDLSYVDEQQTQFLKRDSLLFQVAEVELNENSTAVIPVEVTMTDFEARKLSKGWLGNSEKWFSEPFYTHLGGYKMCLGIVSNGCGDGQSTHVSMHIYLMRGEYDDQLTWPFQGTITIQLLKQDGSGEQWEKKVDVFARSVMFWHERATCGRGYTKFIPHRELYKEDVEYIQSDSLKFRVSQVVIKST